MNSKHPWFVVVVFAVLWLVAGGIFLLLLPKGDEVLFFRNLQQAELDRLFTYITQIGEAPMIAAIALLMLFYRAGDTIQIGTSGLIGLVVVQTLKQGVFADHHRPVRWFAEQGVELSAVAGIDMHQLFSMPSGHTAAAFALFTSLALTQHHRVGQWTYLSVAMLVGLSRIVLAQHFYEDVFFGALLGMFLAFGTYLLLDRVGLWRTAWAHHSIVKTLIRD